MLIDFLKNLQFPLSGDIPGKGPVSDKKVQSVGGKKDLTEIFFRGGKLESVSFPFMSRKSRMKNILGIVIEIKMDNLSLLTFVLPSAQLSPIGPSYPIK